MKIKGVGKAPTPFRVLLILARQTILKPSQNIKTKQIFKIKISKLLNKL